MRRTLLTAVTIALAAGAVVHGAKFRSTWKAPDVDRLNFAGRKVAAVVISPDQDLQISAEEELARQAAALGQACEAMRAETRTLESGMRLARVNARGEQEVVSEEERAARLNALRKDLQAHCPTS